MWSKLKFWFTNFFWGLIAIMIAVVMHYYGIILRLTEMVVPNNRIFVKGSELCSELTHKLLGWDQRRGG